MWQEVRGNHLWEQLVGQPEDEIYFRFRGYKEKVKPIFMLLSSIGVNDYCWQCKVSGCMGTRDTNMCRIIDNSVEWMQKKWGEMSLWELACKSECDTWAYDDPISYEWCSPGHIAQWHIEVSNFLTFNRLKLFFERRTEWDHAFKRAKLNCTAGWMPFCKKCLLCCVWERNDREHFIWVKY